VCVGMQHELFQLSAVVKDLGMVDMISCASAALGLCSRTAGLDILEKVHELVSQAKTVPQLSVTALFDGGFVELLDWATTLNKARALG
jgi:hypothetical protein